VAYIPGTDRIPLPGPSISRLNRTHSWKLQQASATRNKVIGVSKDSRATLLVDQVKVTSSEVAEMSRDDDTATNWQYV